MHEELQQQIIANVEQYREAREAFATRTFAGTSDNGYVTITVDANGRLIESVVDPRAFRRTQDSTAVNEAILQASQRACAEADAAYAELTAAEPGETGRPDTADTLIATGRAIVEHALDDMNRPRTGHGKDTEGGSS